MKKLTLLFMLIARLVYGQQQSSITLTTNAPNNVGTVTATRVGNQGNSTYYYWVVSRWNIGQSTASMVQVPFAPDSLTGSNYIRLNWTPNGATTYDVMRTNAPTLPSSCNCAIATGLTVGTVSDTGGGLSAYTYNPVGTTTATFNLDNADYLNPTVTENRDFQAPVVQCLGSPGNSKGPYRSLCSSGVALWLCQNTGGCTVAADWTGVAIDPYIVSATSNSSTAYAGVANPVFGGYAAGQTILLIPDVATTSSAPTLNVSGFGAKTITLADGVSQLPYGAFTPSQPILLAYDGTVLRWSNGPALSFQHSRTISGCPLFPDQTIFNTDISKAPRDNFGTLYYLGHHSITSAASWSGGTVTMTVNSTQGLATGLKVYINSVTPSGYNTGYGTLNDGTDPRVTITVLNETQFTYPLVSNPGSYVSGGVVSIGPYGGVLVGGTPEFALNLFNNSTPTLQASQINPQRDFLNTYCSDNIPMAITNNSLFDGFTGTGTPPIVANGPFYPSVDAHVLALNTDTCILSELYGLQGTVPPVYARNMSVWDLRSTAMRTARLTTSDTAGCTSADAAGLPIFPLTPTIDQIYGTTPFTSMMRFTLPVTQNVWVWPGTHRAGNNNSGIVPPMGTVFRLKDSYDTTTCANGANTGLPFPTGSSNTPRMQQWLAAMKKYGLILADVGTAGLITYDNYLTSAQNIEVVGWLHCVTMDNFEVVNTNPLQSGGTSLAVAAFAPVTSPELLQITVASNPAGLTLVVDGNNCTSPCVFGWDKSSSHTIAANTQSAGGGSQYVFSLWSDGGGQSHTVSPASVTTYTATFTTQYQLTINIGGSGTVTPASGTYYDPGSVVAITATPNIGNTFLGFSGALTGTTNPQNVTINAPTTVNATFAVSVPWGPSLTAWNFRKPVYVNPALGGSSLTSFPVLVNVVDSELEAALANGNDFTFTSSDGATVVPYEREYWDSATGTLVAHVNVSSLPSSGQTALFLYYGNAAASDQQNPTAVWDSNYAAVFHLKDGTTLNINDSTSNANNGTYSASHATATAGKIDGAGAFVAASSQSISTGATGMSFSHSTPFTFEAWVKPTDVASRHTIFGRQAGGTTYTNLELNSAVPRFLIGATGGEFAVSGTSSVTSGTMYHIVAVRDVGTLRMYINGNPAGTATESTSGDFFTGYTAPNIGATGTPSLFMNGTIDELRISSTNRSAGWIATEYSNQNSPTLFVTLFSQQHQ